MATSMPGPSADKTKIRPDLRMNKMGRLINEICSLAVYASFSTGRKDLIEFDDMVR